MRTISIILFALATAVVSTFTTETFTGIYTGLENDMYVFTTEEGTTMEFDDISPEALKKYNITDEALVGKTFTVSYESLTYTDEETEEDIVKYTIVDLELLEE